MDQVFEDTQVKHIGAAATVKSPKLGEIRIVNQAVKLSRTPASMASAPPETGEHTAEILKELGYDQAAIDVFREKKIV
jgi:formyl-CoA transferase